LKLPIAHDYRGRALPEAERAELRLTCSADVLRIEVDAPYFGDPPPSAAVGPTDRLWEHEVVELFIADAGEHYLEVELSPHGHHLVLELCGVRRVVRSQLAIEYRVAIDHAARRFRGVAEVPVSYLPDRAVRVNAYAIHGQGGARTYCAHSPASGHSGQVPDFHRLECFVPLALGASPQGGD
jgi:hypothetical protein